MSTTPVKKIELDKKIHVRVFSEDYVSSLENLIHNELNSYANKKMFDYKLVPAIVPYQTQEYGIPTTCFKYTATLIISYFE